MYTVIVWDKIDNESFEKEWFYNLDLSKALKLMAVYDKYCCELLYNGTHIMQNI